MWTRVAPQVCEFFNEDDEETLLRLYAYLDRHKPTMLPRLSTRCGRSLRHQPLRASEGRSHTRYIVNMARQIFCYLAWPLRAANR